MLALLAVLALPFEPGFGEPVLPQPTIPVPDGVLDIVGARGLHLMPGREREISKKQRWLSEKVRRRDVHLTDNDLRARSRTRRVPRRAGAAAASAPAEPWRPGMRIEPLTTLYNIWTREALPLLPGDDQIEPRFHRFLRDHFTNQATRMDVRLIEVLRRAAERFSAPRIEVVSGYRSPKYNLMLRKKGRQVARESQHVGGHAVDFRIRGVNTKVLLNFVRSLRLGGVGFYPRSQFVHSDTGRIRYWTGS